MSGVTFRLIRIRCVCTLARLLDYVYKYDVIHNVRVNVNFISLRRLLNEVALSLQKKRERERELIFRNEKI